MLCLNTGLSYMYLIARRKECKGFMSLFTAVNKATYNELPKWNWTKIPEVSISSVNETVDGINYWIDKYTIMKPI